MSVFPMPRLVVALAVSAALVSFVATPGGLLTKADIVGYAVCHQIESHSFTVAGRQLPLCARCSGTFLGALIGLFGQAVLGRRRAAKFPATMVIVILAGFTLLWTVDGLNSYLTLIRGPHLYRPRNWLRLASGGLNGLTMSVLVYPILNVTLWREPAREQAIRGWRDWGVLLLFEAGMMGLVLGRWPILLYPLALLSALGVLTLLTAVNTTLVLIIVGLDNLARNWREAIVPLSAGFTVSLIEIGVIDVIRYELTSIIQNTSLLQ